MAFTTLMALADLDDDDRYLALFHGIAAVADDWEGQPPRTDTEPLGGAPSLNRASHALHAQCWSVGSAISNKKLSFLLPA